MANEPKVWSAVHIQDPHLNMPEPDWSIDIEVYAKHGPGHWAQALYLAHGLEDVLWTDNLGEAIQFIWQDLASLEKKP